MATMTQSKGWTRIIDRLTKPGVDPSSCPPLPTANEQARLNAAFANLLDEWMNEQTDDVDWAAIDAEFAPDYPGAPQEIFESCRCNRR